MARKKSKYNVFSTEMQDLVFNWDSPKNFVKFRRTMCPALKDSDLLQVLEISKKTLLRWMRGDSFPPPSALKLLTIIGSGKYPFFGDWEAVRLTPEGVSIDRSGPMSWREILKAVRERREIEIYKHNAKVQTPRFI